MEETDNLEILKKYFQKLSTLQKTKNDWSWEKGEVDDWFKELEKHKDLDAKQEEERQKRQELDKYLKLLQQKPRARGTELSEEWPLHTNEFTWDLGNKIFWQYASKLSLIPPGKRLEKFWFKSNVTGTILQVALVSEMDAPGDETVPPTHICMYRAKNSSYSNLFVVKIYYSVV